MKISKDLLVKIIPFAVVIALAFAAGFLTESIWSEYRDKHSQTDDEAIMESLSSIIVLPEELPSIATVTDKEKLNNEPFFSKAENGDKVIIYTQNKRAYLFRPSEQKIIDMTVVATGLPMTDSIPVFETGGQ